MVTKKQKRFIRKYATKLSPEDIAIQIQAQLGEVHQYLHKQSLPLTANNSKYSYRRPNYSPSSIFTLLNRSKWILIFLALLTCAVYANSLQGEFVMDDVTYFIKNDHIASFRFVLETPFTMVKALINWLTYNIGGLNPLGFHIVNILFHIGNVIMVYILASVMYSSWVGIIAASIISVHPIFTESITWIGGGGYAMFTFFFLSSFLFYIVSKGNKRLTNISILFFILTLGTSEKALPLSLIFLVYELSHRNLMSNWKRTMPYIFFTVIWAFFLFIGSGYFETRIKALQLVNNNTVGYYNPLVQIPIATSTYLELLVWPFNIAFFHSQSAFTVTEFILRTVSFVLLLGVAFWSWLKNREAFFWVSIFFISLLPTFSPIIISWIAAERYVYLGAIALTILFATSVSTIFDSPKYRFLGIVILTTLVTLLSAKTISRNNDWRNHATLAKSSIQKAPHDPRIHNNLGSSYYDQGLYDEAEKEFNAAIKIKPSYAGGYYNLAIIAQRRAQPDKAEKLFLKAIEVGPTQPEAYRYLASVYFDQERYGEAKTLLEKAIANGIRNSFFLSNLGLVYNKLGDNAKAVALLTEAVTLDPGNTVAASWLKQFQSQKK